MIPEWAILRWKTQRELEQQGFERDLFELGREPMASEKKIVVPEGMLKAAIQVARADVGYPHPDSDNSARIVGTARRSLEAALGWLSENPIAPTREDIEKMLAVFPYGRTVDMCEEWQRRMFLAPPEPDPDEPIKDLLAATHGVNSKRYDETVREAFRRGQRAQEKR